MSILSKNFIYTHFPRRSFTLIYQFSNIYYDDFRQKTTLVYLAILLASSQGQTRSRVYRTKTYYLKVFVFILLVVSRCLLTIKQLLLSHTIEACPEQRSHYESDENRPTRLRQNIIQPACADTDELEAHDQDNRYNYVQTVAQNGILDLDGLPVFLFTHINTPFGPV